MFMLKLLGTVGMEGRVCNATSGGADRCQEPVLRPGPRDVRKVKCGCKFHWCCFVECETCEVVVEQHRCRGPGDMNTIHLDTPHLEQL